MMDMSMNSYEEVAPSSYAVADLWVTFQVGAKFFAVNVSDVDTILKASDLELISANKAKLHNSTEVLYIVNLREAWGFFASNSHREMVIVMNIFERKWGLIVDDVLDVQYFDPKATQLDKAEGVEKRFYDLNGLKREMLSLSQLPLY